jgi:hypothetical protein
LRADAPVVIQVEVIREGGIATSIGRDRGQGDEPGLLQPGLLQTRELQAGPLRPGPLRPGPLQPGPLQPGPWQPGPQGSARPRLLPGPLPEPLQLSWPDATGTARVGVSAAVAGSM